MSYESDEVDTRRFVHRAHVARCEHADCRRYFTCRVIFYGAKLFVSAPRFCPACRREAQAFHYDLLVQRHRAAARSWRTAADRRQDKLREQFEAQTAAAATVDSKGGTS